MPVTIKEIKNSKVLDKKFLDKLKLKDSREIDGISLKDLSDNKEAINKVLGFLDAKGDLNNNNFIALLNLAKDKKKLDFLEKIAALPAGKLPVIPRASFIQMAQMGEKQCDHILIILNNLPPGKQLDKKTFNLIQTGIANLSDAGHAKSFSNCVNMLLDKNVSLTQFIGTNKISLLLKRDKEQLQSLEKVLNVLSKHKALDERTIDFLLDMKNAPKIKENADSLVKAFDAMGTAKIPIEGHRRAMMAMHSDELNSLAKVLKSFEGSSKIPSPHAFEILRKNMGKKAQGKEENLGPCLRAMMDSDIPFTQDIGRDKLERLLDLDPTPLKGAAKIFKTLSDLKALDGPTVDYVAKQAKDLNLADIDKVDALCEAFIAMDDAGIPIQGNRQPLMVMNQAELQALTGIIGAIKEIRGREGTISQDEFKALRVNVEILAPLSPEKTDAFKTCVVAMEKAHISLTQTLGEDKLSKLAKLPEEELAPVASVLETLSTYKEALDEKTFNYVVSKAGKFSEDKVNLIPQVFKAMDQLGVLIKGNRQPVMNMEIAKLGRLKTVLDELKTAGVTKLEQRDFKALLTILKREDNNFTIKTSAGKTITDTDKIKLFAACVNAMTDADPKIPLTQTIGENNIDRLSKLDNDQLIAVKTILTSLPKKDRDEKTFNYVIASATDLKAKAPDDLKTKAPIISAIFTAMPGLVPIQGNRQPIMKMKWNDLNKLNSVLNVLQADKKVPLDQTAFKALIDLLPTLKDDRTEAFAKCVKAMAAAKIPLTQIVGEDNIVRLSELDKSQLDTVATILTSLSEEAPDEALDEKIFKSLVAKVKELTPSSVQDISNTFKAMKALQLPIKENMQAVINTGKELGNLKTVLEELKKAGVDKIEQRDFKALQSHIDNFKEQTNKIADFAACVKAIKDAQIPLTQAIGENNIDRLSKLSKDELETVKTILTSLPKEDLDEKIFKYVVAKAPDLKTSATAIAGTFKAMEALHIPIQGNRQDVINMGKDLGKLKTVLEALQTAGVKKLEQRDFEAIQSHIEDFDPATTVGSRLIACIKAMTNAEAKVPLTQAIGENNIDRLRKLPDEQLKTVETILTSLPKDALDEKTFNYVVANAKELKENAQDISDIFKEMGRQGMTIKGNRQPIMEMGKEELQKLKTILPHFDGAKLDKDAVKILLNNTDKITTETAPLLRDCIKILQDNKLGITQLFGQDKLDRLAKLDKGQLQAVSSLLKTLDKVDVLDDKTANYIIDHAGELQSKAERINRIFNAMDTAGILIEGNRQPIMNLTEKELERFEGLLEKLPGVAGNTVAIKKVIDCAKATAKTESVDYEREAKLMVSSTLQ
ncbi:Uncharacterised protein [Legionella lansingensis]|uniref:Uncharacterized protein n=1 Tax=Legionella lansingensis TaxID=45067 RepID=A0A0W0VGT3_9GAMM|nr:hypothetical protein [Legionella lansingensis]KTD19344.1 hypothetical protein Llan_2082 [Legionella lansingensis]SNV52936.1 Uncharacterised protein [Legionella lansingensis]